jgi:hypothetical protein
MNSETSESASSPLLESPEPPSPAPEGGDETDSPVNYEGPALVDTEIDGIDYRIDVGKQGTALCISSRPTGPWGWAFAGEARWDASTLRSKTFDRQLLDRLAPALVEAVANME